MLLQLMNIRTTVTFCHALPSFFLFFTKNSRATITKHSQVTKWMSENMIQAQNDFKVHFQTRARESMRVPERMTRAKQKKRFREWYYIHLDD